MKKLALFCASLLLALTLGRVEAATTLTIVEPGPYYMGQTIHVVTSPLHGRDEQRVLCTQNGQYVYSESNMGTDHSYVLDTPNIALPWDHTIPAYCEAFVWNGVNPNTRNPIVPFTVYP